jgi:hypothetical protein
MISESVAELGDEITSHPISEDFLDEIKWILSIYLYLNM